MHHGDAGAIAIQIEGGFRGGIFAADHDDILAPIGMRLRVVMRDERKIFAGNVEQIRQIVVASGHDNFARRVRKRLARFDGLCVYAEITVGTFEFRDRLVQTQAQVVVLGSLAVTHFVEFGARRFLGSTDQRKVTDLEELGCRRRRPILTG